MVYDNQQQPHDDNDDDDDTAAPSAIIDLQVTMPLIIGGEDRPRAPLPADEPLPSDTLFPGTDKE